MLVHRAQRPEIGVGGHISTYASSASLYEVGMNHFFRGKDHPGGGDQLFFQGHASPGMYARAFLEGRLNEHQLDGFRQELSHPGGGLPSGAGVCCCRLPVPPHSGLCFLLLRLFQEVGHQLSDELRHRRIVLGAVDP